MASTVGCRIEVSPTLAYDTPGTIAEVRRLHARAERPNLFVKIPGTPEGVPAIEESIFAGVPVNVTLLFSREQYLAAAEAYLRGIERRIQAGLNPDVCSLASVFISRWDKATMEKVPGELRGQAWDRRRQANLQSLSPTARFGRDGCDWQMLEPGHSDCSGLARVQRTRRFRRSLHQGARRAIHRQHDS